MEDQIISMLRSRDEQGLRLIRAQYGELCCAVAYQILGSREDAEECVNDMLLDVWNSSAELEPTGLRAYLVTLTRRSAIDMLRAQHRQKRGGAQFAAALDELAEILPADEQVEQQVEQRELTAALTAWLRSLPSDSQRIFMQRYYFSDSIEAIAEKNRMSRGAVKMALSRLRKKLRLYLREEGLL